MERAAKPGRKGADEKRAEGKGLCGEGLVFPGQSDQASTVFFFSPLLPNAGLCPAPSLPYEGKCKWAGKSDENPVTVSTQ